MTDETPLALAGAVDGMRMLKDGSISVSLIFEPKDRNAVMAMMGEPGASIGCARLRNGHAAKGGCKHPHTTAIDPAKNTGFSSQCNDCGAKLGGGSLYREFGPICREAIDLCNNPSFHGYVKHVKASVIKQEAAGTVMVELSKAFILSTCSITSRKELDTAEGARELFIAHVRKPFHAWLEKQQGEKR